MCRGKGRSVQVFLAAVCAITFLARGSSLSANDFYVYGQYTVPGPNRPVAGIGGYVEDYGVPTTWGDEIQYVYFVDSEMYAYKVQVWTTNEGSINDPTSYVDPLQHPNNPAHPGPVEPRKFKLVEGPVRLHLSKRMYTRGEFHVDSKGVFLGPSEGIHKFDHRLRYIDLVAPEFNGVSLAYDPLTRTWYSGSEFEQMNRQIHRLRDTDNDGDFMDETWEYVFTHSDYDGKYHAGLEYADGYLWISERTSDVIARWHYDNATDSWSEVRTYNYSEPAQVAGMGFGPNGLFWISADYDDNYFYEVGGQFVANPIAYAGTNVYSWPPEVALPFPAAGWHPEYPQHMIKLYEWDYDDAGDDIYDQQDTNPIGPPFKHAYPAFRTDLNDPYSIDWEETAKCYTAKLRVTDDLHNTGVDTRLVCITPPPWDPVADAGGPYAVRVNEVLCLKSESFHPADSAVQPGHAWHDEIILWEWDLDGDSILGGAGETGEEPCMSWSQEGTYFVPLRVTDHLGTTDQDIAVVVVYAIHDVAVTEVTPLKTTDIHECDVIPVDVNVLNLGDYEEQNFTVKISCDGVQFAQAIVNSLAISETTTLSFLWDTTGISAGLHKIRGCAQVVPGEIRIANNCLTTVVEVDHKRTLTISSGDNGSVTTPGEGDFLYDDGTDVPVEATPDDHYHLVEWTGTAVDASKVTPTDSPSATVTVEGSCYLSLHANFALDTHTLTTSSTFGGSVTTPGEETKEYEYGQIVALEAEETEPDYRFIGWIGPVADATSLKTSITITQDTSVKAVFAKSATYSGTVDSSDAQPGTYFLPPGIDDDSIWNAEGGKYYRGYYNDWSWTHTFSPPEPLPDIVDSATLEIEAFDVDSFESNKVYGDGVLLGQLEPRDDRWNVTTIEFNTEALEQLMDGTVDIRIDISTDNGENHTHWKLAIRSSTLTVNYSTITDDN